MTLNLPLLHSTPPCPPPRPFPYGYAILKKKVSEPNHAPILPAHFIAIMTLVHIVLFEFKPTTSLNTIQDVSTTYNAVRP
jgi:hypothetical protein